MSKRYFFVACMAIIIVFGSSIKGKAANAQIEITSEESEVVVGEILNVSCIVAADKKFSHVSAYLAYDNDMLEFVDGGNFFTGEAGVLKWEGDIKSGNNLKFPVRFRALKSGEASITVSGTPVISNKKGNTFKISSNRYTVPIQDNGTGTSITPTENLSADNYLSSLRINTGTLNPIFQRDKEKYKATVDYMTSILYFSYTKSDEGARVSFIGNESLQEGNNEVQVVVTAPNESVRTYTIKVYKESKEETLEREAKEEGTVKKGITFSIEEIDGKKYLLNSYEFQVIDPEEGTEIPAGFIKSNILLNSVEVPAYTMKEDLDHDILLLYLMNEDGESQFYQFDRVEKTIQRYTGKLISKVNAYADSSNDDSDNTLETSEYIAIMDFL